VGCRKDVYLKAKGYAETWACSFPVSACGMLNLKIASILSPLCQYSSEDGLPTEWLLYSLFVYFDSSSFNDSDGVVSFKAFDDSDGVVSFNAFDDSDGVVSFNALDDSDGVVSFNSFDDSDGVLSFNSFGFDGGESLFNDSPSRARATLV